MVVEVHHAKEVDIVIGMESGHIFLRGTLGTLLIEKPESEGEAHRQGWGSM